MRSVINVRTRSSGSRTSRAIRLVRLGKPSVGAASFRDRFSADKSDSLSLESENKPLLRRRWDFQRGHTLSLKLILSRPKYKLFNPRRERPRSANRQSDADLRSLRRDDYHQGAGVQNCLPSGLSVSRSIREAWLFACSPYVFILRPRMPWFPVNESHRELSRIVSFRANPLKPAHKKYARHTLYC
jgi:hypothetical protein